ncbi:MAG: response regulator [Bryobacteraceae bacterium]
MAYSHRILVVEDDADQLLLRGMLLRQSGFDVMQASDAGSAIGLAKSGKPECAVIDLRLPTEELGWKLIRELKALDPKLRIVVFTGLNPARLAQGEGKNLVDEFVVKGSSSANLIEKIKALAEPDRNRP